MEKEKINQSAKIEEIDLRINKFPELFPESAMSKSKEADVPDAGPIIEQDVVRVSHRDSVDDLVRKGRDLEKIVLARTVNHHLNNKILVYGNKTVVFD